MKDELDRISIRLEELQKALLLLEFLQHGGGMRESQPEDEFDHAELQMQDHLRSGMLQS